MSEDTPGTSRELGWRPGRQADLQAALRGAVDPRLREELREDLRLNALLNRLPPAPVPSNFAARVLAEAAREQPVHRPNRRYFWPAWLPRVAFALFVGATALFSYHQIQNARETRLVEGIGIISDVAAVPGPEILKDYEAIQALKPAFGPGADEELLALLQ